MAISSSIERKSLDDLWLDPRNPRLGHSFTSLSPSQDMLLERMRSFSLEELATSFLSTFFWPQEALLYVRETHDGEVRNVVVEGNRRLAALKFLKRTFDGHPPSRQWIDIIRGYDEPTELFESIPCINADSREDVTSFLGFRHVTGVKDWEPTEKAEYISHIIDTYGRSYDEVAKQLGSRRSTIRKQYIAYNITKQVREISPELHCRIKFGTWYRALATPGIVSYLCLDLNADPPQAHHPVPEDHLDNLERVFVWLFGSDEKRALLPDSRYIDRLSKILSDEASL